MPKDVIGSAYVRIVAMSQDFEKQVQASFDRLKPVAGKAGEDASQAWTDGFTKHFGQTMADAQERVLADMSDEWGKNDHGKVYGDKFGEDVNETITAHQDETVDRMGKSWEAAGAAHGKSYGDPFSTEVDRAMGRSVDNSTNLWRNSNLMKFPLEAIQELADDMPNILGRGADRAAPRVQSSFSNIGQGIRAMLSDAFGGTGGGSIFKSLTDGAEHASRSFTMLFSIGQLVGSALGGLVAGIANVVSGLFAVVSAASAAAPALAVLPGLLAAIAQAGITLLVGFKGVGQAISAGMKEAAASTGTASARARELSSAQRAVESASRSLQSAEKASANAKKDLAAAQKDLNDAYKEGAKQLRDIQYAAEDAALQEERSAINLANARDELERTKATNPPDSRAVQEAELAYKEADLAYREARSRNKDASEEANDATKKGVKGTQAVTSAQDRLTRAQENVVASNQRVADSQRALADAQQRLADVQSGATGTTAAYTKALEKFGPQGQKFIKTIVGMRGQFKGLKEAAGESVFASLNRSLNILVNGPFFGILKRNFADTSTVIAGFVDKFTDMISSARNMSAIDRIMQSNTIVLGSFGDAAVKLGDALIAIMDAARPLTEEFARWLSDKVVDWSKLITAKRDAGTLAGTLSKAADVARILGRIFGNIFGAIFNTGKAATNGGNAILDWLDEATGKWEAWTKSVGGQNQLKEYFDNVAEVFPSILEGVNAIVKELLKLGGNKDITKGIGPALQAIASVIAPMGKALGAAMPLFASLGDHLAEIFNALQDSPALTLFVGVLDKVAGGISYILNLPGASKLIYYAGAIMGVVRALKFLSIGFSFLAKATIGNTLKNIQGVGKGFGLLMKGKNPFGSAVKGSEEARKEFEKQMKVDELKKKAMDGIGKAGKHAADGLDKSTKASKLSRAKDTVARLVGRGTPDPTGKREAPKTASRGRTVAGKLGKGLAIGGAALGGVGLAVGALAAVATLNKDSAAALGTQISDMAKNLPVALSALAAQIPMILNSIAQAIGPLINTIAAALPGVIQSIIKALPTVINAIMSALPKVLDAVTKMLPIVIGAIAKLLPMLIQVIAAALPKVISAVVGVIPVIIKALAKALPIVIKALAKALPLIIKAIVGAIPEIIKAIVTALPLIINAISESLPLIVGAVAEAIPEIIKAVVEAIPLIVTAIVQALPAIWEALKALIPAVGKAITEAIPKILAALGELVSAIGTWITENGPKILSKLGEWTSQFVTWVGEVIAKLPSVLGGIISAIWSWITTNGPGLLVKLGEWTLKFVSWVGSLIIRMPIELGKLWLKIAGWIVGIVPQIAKKIAGWITSFLGWIGDLVSKIPGKLAAIWTAIAKWIGEIPSKVTKAAANVWGGLFSGIKSAFVASLNWVIDKWNSVRFPSITVPGVGETPDRLPHINPIKLAAGGTVLAQPGGVLATIAEAGKNEVVKPLDNKGLTASDRAIMAMIQQQGRMLSELVAALVPRNARTGLAPAVASTAATAAVVATQRTLSTTSGSAGSTAPELVTAINSLTASVDSLQRPLVGGDINVTSAPGERADVSVPAMLRRRAYTRPGAR